MPRPLSWIEFFEGSSECFRLRSRLTSKVEAEAFKSLFTEELLFKGDKEDDDGSPTFICSIRLDFRGTCNNVFIVFDIRTKSTEMGEGRSRFDLRRGCW